MDGEREREGGKKGESVQAIAYLGEREREREREGDKSEESNRRCGTGGHWPDSEPGNCNLEIFFGVASSSEKILDGC